MVEKARAHEPTGEVLCFSSAVRLSKKSRAETKPHERTIHIAEGKFLTVIPSRKVLERLGQSKSLNVYGDPNP